MPALRRYARWAKWICLIQLVHYPRIIVYIQAVFFLVAGIILRLGFGYATWPLPGICIGAVGLAAIIMAARGKLEQRETIVWVAIGFLFFSLETVSIYKQNADNQEQAERARVQEDNRFAGILKQNHEQFDKTMTSVATVFDETRMAASDASRSSQLANEALKNVLGEGASPCIVPVTLEATDGNIPLLAWNRGSRVLTGLDIKIMGENDFEPTTKVPLISLGTLHPSMAKTVPSGLTIPPLSASKEMLFTITMWAQSGYFDEIIWVRIDKRHISRYAVRYWVNRYYSTGYGKGIYKNAAIGPWGRIEKEKNCSRMDWSDVLPGKPQARYP